MSIEKEIELILKSEFQDKNSLISQDEFEEIWEKLNQLTTLSKPNGYTIPPFDTVGMNLKDTISCSSQLDLKK